MKGIYALTIAFSMAMILLAAPVKAAPVEAESYSVSAAAPDVQDINVTVSGSNIRVTGAAKQTLVVYYITGTKAASFAIDSDDQTFSTSLGKGVYLCKIGKYVRKVSIS